MRQIVLVLCLLLSAGYALADSTTITYQFPAPRLSQVETYTAITLGQLPLMARPGIPALPVKTACILVPAGKHLDSITVTPKGTSTIPLRRLVCPGAHVHPLSLKPQGPLALPRPNPAIYAARSPFPGFQPDFMIQHLLGYEIIILRLYPIQYWPMQEQLQVARELEVTVQWKAGASRSSLRRSRAGDIVRVKALVDNPQDLSDQPRQGRDQFTYIIITNQTLYDSQEPYNFQKLLQHRQAQGISGKIELVEDIAANYSGKDLGAKIRNYIKYAYQNWGTTYVLLGGDADTKQMSVIPAVGFYAEAEGYTDQKIPADMYYGCLDGDFDHNGNGILGEPDDGPDGGEVDLLAEVYIGRAPVDTVTELNNFVKKTLYYDNLPADTAYLHNVLLLGEYLWTSNVNGKIWGGDHMDELVGSSQAHGINTQAIPTRAHFTKLYERDNTFNTTDLKNAIRQGVHYLNHLGHSNNTSNMKLSNSSIPHLDNENRYFFGYTQGCYAGAFDNKTSWWTTSSDAFLEEMLSQPVGAFAYLGNSRYGWGNDHTTKGPSHMYVRQFYHALAQAAANQRQLGRLNQLSKEANIGMINEVAMRWCYYEVTLFGDPIQSLKTIPAK